jgi:hypothetical protein
MASENEWWYCLKHHRVEQGTNEPVKDRLGPYATAEEASHALETVQRRNEEWDSRD